MECGFSSKGRKRARNERGIAWAVFYLNEGYESKLHIGKLGFNAAGVSRGAVLLNCIDCILLLEKYNSLTDERHQSNG
jgi:hypothetical protein